MNGHPLLHGRSVWAVALTATAVALALFAYIFGPALPLADARFWLAPPGDMATMTAGFEALEHDRWRFPLAVTGRLIAGSPTSIVFTDSIPWLSLVLKATGAGNLFNVLGLFLVASYVLQVLGMTALLRALEVRRPSTLFLGAMMALLAPAWLARQLGHPALSGHWLLLFALALAVSSIRQGLTTRRGLGFVALAVLATGIHAYHLAPIAACFGAALLSELLQRRTRAFARGALWSAAMLAAVGGSAWVLGYGYGMGSSGGAAVLGVYSMNLAGPLWPQASGLAGHRFNGVWFSGVIDPTNGQSFEGFNYLGGGALLLLLAAAGSALWTRRKRASSGAAVKAYLPLILAMAALALLAVGPIAYLGNRLVYRLPLPDGKLTDTLAIFRAHGRFFWSVGYLLLAVAIARLDRVAPRVIFIPVAIAALAIQLVDTAPLRSALRITFQVPRSAVYPPSFDTAATLRGRPWVFFPTYFCDPDYRDQQLLAQLALVAVRTGGSSNSAQTARMVAGSCDFDPSLAVDARPNDPRLTVVLNKGSETGGDFERVSGRSDCGRFGRAVICGSGIGRLPGVAPVAGRALKTPPRVLLQKVMFNEGIAPPALKSGWTKPGDKGVWSEGKVAVLEFAPPKRSDPRSSLFLELRAIGYSDPPLRPQHVGVLVGGRLLGRLTVDPALMAPYSLVIPAELVPPAGPLQIQFDIPEARAPGGADQRLLGLGLESASLYEQPTR